MRLNKIETAKKLAQGHFKIEKKLKHVFLLEPINEEDPNEPIKLLEIVEGTIERGIEPIAFTPAPQNGINFPSVIIEVSPKEYEMILNGSLNLINGWSIFQEIEKNT